MLSSPKKGKYQSSNGSLAIATGSVASLATAAEVLLVLGEKATEKSSKRRHRKASKMERTQKTERRLPGQCVSTPGSGLLYGKRESRGCMAFGYLIRSGKSPGA